MSALLFWVGLGVLGLGFMVQNMIVEGLRRLAPLSRFPCAGKPNRSL